MKRVSNIALTVIAILLIAPATQAADNKRGIAMGTLIRFLATGTRAYKAAPNELKKSVVRSQRKAGLKKMFGRSKSVSGWTGTIKSMGTNGDGNAYVTIQLTGSKVEVLTMNNAFSDIAYGTLIPQGSAVFNSLANLSVGDKVRFSGRFLAGDKDFIAEMSLTERGSMTAPELVFKFSSLTK